MIYITGDTHGELERLLYIQREKFNSPKDEVVVAGDFGVLWDTSPPTSWPRGLTKPVLFVDGNHENFELLNSLPQVFRYGNTVGALIVNGVEVAYHLQRGRVYRIDSRKVFTYGGASSVDKKYRIPGISWWPEEVPTQEEFERGLQSIVDLKEKRVDFVISHAAPRQALGIVQEGLEKEFGSGRYTTTMLEEIHKSPVTFALTEFCTMVDFQKWFFGHYHFNHHNERFYGLYEQVEGA